MAEEKLKIMIALNIAQLALASKLNYKFIQGCCHYVRRGGVKESDGEVKAKEG